LQHFYVIEGYLRDDIETLKYLKDSAGTLILKARRKIFVLGFTLSALSIMNICKELLEGREGPVGIYLNITLLSRSN